MNRNNRAGFTLIELLVVIGIIGILSSLIVVYFNTAKMTARDSRRLSDVKQIQLALKMYYNDTGIYPTAITAGSSIANGGTNYLLRVPSNPTPRADNQCPDQDYQYKQLDGGQRYSLGFCLGDKTDDLDAGIKSATANGILNCPTGYVAVPGSSTFGTNDFCVMKYEAKCATTAAPTVGLTSPATGNNTYDNGTTACATTRQAVSVASGYPIGNASRTNAIDYCNAIGGHLMTNAEWMTIARNIEATSSNWTSSVINNGNATGSNTVLIGTPEGSGTSKRTHTLSNGETIWDIAGNVAEILNTTCTAGTGVGNYYDTSQAFIEWTDSNLDDYERAYSGPLNAGLNDTTNKIGRYGGCTDGRGFVRGGFVNNDTSSYAGIYTASINTNTSGAAPRFGFRCVK